MYVKIIFGREFGCIARQIRISGPISIWIYAFNRDIDVLSTVRDGFRGNYCKICVAVLLLTRRREEYCAADENSCRRPSR